MYSEKEVLDIAMRNSYEVLVNGIDEGDFDFSEFIFFAHNPGSRFKKKEIEGMLIYFTEIEEYEKCIKLKEKLDLKEYSRG